MSVAGIQSNRGDYYQKLIALDWLITVATNDSYEWLEVDSANYSVDDIVVHKKDGSIICCQCKKNHPKQTTWTISDLQNELLKTHNVLVEYPTAEIRFYSRSPFGQLHSLVDWSKTQSDETGYLANIPTSHQQTQKKLADILPNDVNIYQFLKQLVFVIEPDDATMKERIYERLKLLITYPDKAFNILWSKIDRLSSRVSDTTNGYISHSITKSEITQFITEQGLSLSSPMDIKDLKRKFKLSSSIGRAWNRTISGIHLDRNIVNEILNSIQNKPHSILLTGSPGSGKTCILLDIQESLEQLSLNNNQIFPIYIQSRDYSDADSHTIAEAKGLPSLWVECIARLAEHTHAVVLIDSLDVLSITREHGVLTYFLAQMDRLLALDNVTVVATCREFDRKFDHRLAVRDWGIEISCPPLSWTDEILPILQTKKIDENLLDKTTRELIKTPREFALYIDIVHRNGTVNVINSQALAQKYIDTIINQNPRLGSEAEESLETIAQKMIKERSLSVNKRSINISGEQCRILLSENILYETTDSKISFGHQTLLDVLVINGAIRSGLTLQQFITSLPPVPFVRPSIRNFVKSLASQDDTKFRKQVRAALLGDSAYHIRRLVAECYAEITPIDSDWHLLKQLYKNHKEVFQVIYRMKNIGIEWHHYWMKNLVPMLLSEQDKEGLTGHCFWLSAWLRDDAEGVITFWIQVLTLKWIDTQRVALQLAYFLHDIQDEALSKSVKLIQHILKLKDNDEDLGYSLGKPLIRSVNAGYMSDAELWQYIVGNLDEDEIKDFNFDSSKKLLIDNHYYEINNVNLLDGRIQTSEVLLDLIIDSIESWSRIKSSRYSDDENSLHNNFLNETSYSDLHTQTDIHYIHKIRWLFNSVEKSISNHAQNDTLWWQQNWERLSTSPELALRYFVVKICTNSPENNLDIIELMLSNDDLFRSELKFEVGLLLNQSYVFLSLASQDSINNIIMQLYAQRFLNEETPVWVYEYRARFIKAIPCHLRTPHMVDALNEFESKYEQVILHPSIRLSGGTVRAPFSHDVFLNYSESNILKLFHYYDVSKQREFMSLIGGKEEVAWQLHTASSIKPIHFLSFLEKFWYSIPSTFKDYILSGVSHHLMVRFGNLRGESYEPIEVPNPEILDIM